MTAHHSSPDNAQCQNTDRHLWPQVSEEENAPRLFATAGGGIGIDVGGHVIVKPLRDWHTLASINAQETRDTVDKAYAWDAVIRARMDERRRCAEIAEAIDSGRGNEKQIAAAILALPSTPSAPGGLEALATQLREAVHFCTEITSLESHALDVAKKLEALAVTSTVSHDVEKTDGGEA